MGSLLDTVGGLPVHALVVHATIVLVPLTAIGSILVVVWRSFSRRYASLVVVFGALAFLSAIVSKESGEQLVAHVQSPAEHIDVGDAMPAVAVFLLGLITVFWLVDRGIPMNRARPLWLTLVGVVLILVALGSLYWTFRVGHTGAEAVWAPIMSKG